MARWCWYLLMFGWLAIQTQAVAQLSWLSKLGSVARHKAVVVSVATLLGSGVLLAVPDLEFEVGTHLGQMGEIERALNNEEIEQAWKRRASLKPRQYASVFYLLIDFPSHWRVMHIEYVGKL